MMDRIKQMKQSDSAVTEIIGTMLLIAISLGLFSVVYVSVLNVPYVPPTPTANIACLVEGNDIVLEHYGGDPIGLQTKLLLSIDDVQSEVTLGDIDGTLSWDKNGDEEWSMGEKIVYSPGSLTGKQVNVNIIDTVSNSIVTVGSISPKNPIITSLNSISYEQFLSPITLTATSTGVDTDNVSLWYKWNGLWEDSFIAGDKFVNTSTNMSFEGGDYATVQQGGMINSVENYVDSSNSNVDGGDVYGSHSLFSNMQNISNPNDVLTEENSASGVTTITLLDDDFESGLGNWITDWDPVDWWYAYTSYDHAMECDRYDSYLRTNDLDTSTGSSITISFNYKLYSVELQDNVNVQYYDGTDYDFKENIGGGSEPNFNTYTDTIYNAGEDAQYFIENFRLRIEADLGPSEYVWIDDVLIEIDESDYNYELDLEVKWETADYDEDNEYLCIYAGPVDSEDIQVDVWNISSGSWANVLPDLNTGWNNVSVEDYLTSANFYIRFKGGSESSDENQDSWEIDAVLLHTWSTADDGFYEGEITSEPIDKPSNCNWSMFYADVNNSVNSHFSILDASDDSVIISDLDENGDDISTLVTADSIKLYGYFDGAVRLDSWNVTVDGEDWQSFGTDTYPYSWSFPFESVDKGFSLYYWFYSIGKVDGYADESQPSNPDYDTSCKYMP